MWGILGKILNSVRRNKHCECDNTMNNLIIRITMKSEKKSDMYGYFTVYAGKMQKYTLHVCEYPTKIATLVWFNAFALVGKDHGQPLKGL